MKTRLFVALLVITCCTFLNPVHAQSATLIDLIQQARKSGDWSEVNRQIQNKAAAGDLASITALSQMQLYGLGTQRDLAQSVATLRKAAEQNFGLAQSVLGFYYALGVGIPKDPKIAAEWYQKAADQGVSEAQYNLGLMYSSGELGVIDEKRSRELYEQAGNKGFAKAWLNLGVTYLQGNKAVTKDLTKAQELLKKAADAGETSAQFNLGLLYMRGDMLPANPSLAYYYLTLANSTDPRGYCVPPTLWVAANLEGFQALSKDLRINQELGRQSCMNQNPQAKKLLDILDQAAEKTPTVKPQLQAARDATLKYLERRKLMDAPVSEQLTDTKTKKYEGEYAFLKSLPKWQVVKMMQRSGDTTISEMRPPNETGDNWTKTLQYEQVSKHQHSKPYQHIELLLTDLRKQCTDVMENKTFDGDEHGFPTYVGSVFCAGKTDPNANAELHLFKAVQGVDSFYFWHFVWRGDKDEMLKDKGSEFSKTIVELTTSLKEQIVCDLRDKQGEKACPAGLPGI